MREATVKINGNMLAPAQALAVRVAVSHLLAELAIPERREEVGAIADSYRARLREVQALLMSDGAVSKVA